MGIFDLLKLREDRKFDNGYGFRLEGNGFDDYDRPKLLPRLFYHYVGVVYDVTCEQFSSKMIKLYGDEWVSQYNKENHVDELYLYRVKTDEDFYFGFLATVLVPYQGRLRRALIIDLSKSLVREDLPKPLHAFEGIVAYTLSSHRHYSMLDDFQDDITNKIYELNSKEAKWRSREEYYLNPNYQLDDLFNRFDGIFIIDLETNGLDPLKDHIIEFSMIEIIKKDEKVSHNILINELVSLPDDVRLNSKIISITQITDAMINSHGVHPKVIADSFVKIVESKTKPLIIAYNAAFDLHFLHTFLKKQTSSHEWISYTSFLDPLTIFKDRCCFPHKLKHAVKFYHIPPFNQHRALDDALATLKVLHMMGKEKSDLTSYINLFGTYEYNERPVLKSLYYKIHFKHQNTTDIGLHHPLYEWVEE